MNIIINDKYYEDTKKLIQKYISEKFLTNDIKNKLIEYYQSLTYDNALLTYNEVSKIYKDEAFKSRRDIDLSILKYSGITFLTGGILTLFSIIGHKIVSKNERRTRTLNVVAGVGSVLMLFGFVNTMVSGVLVISNN